MTAAAAQLPPVPLWAMRVPRPRPAATRAGRIARYVLSAVVVVILIWGIGGYVYIVDPQTAKPHRADAIFVLGPYLNGRVDQAYRLAHQFNIGQVALSVGDTPGQITSSPCTGPSPVAGTQVTCFVPSPYSTRGEARELGSLARRWHWTNVIVIAPKPQLSRARTLIDRCYSGHLQMVPADEPLGFDDWVGQFLHQSFATVKALVVRGC